MGSLDALHIGLIIWSLWSTAMWWMWQGRAEKGMDDLEQEVNRIMRGGHDE